MPSVLFGRPIDAMHGQRGGFAKGGSLGAGSYPLTDLEEAMSLARGNSLVVSRIVFRILIGRLNRGTDDAIRIADYIGLQYLMQDAATKGPDVHYA